MSRNIFRLAEQLGEIRERLLQEDSVQESGFDGTMALLRETLAVAMEGAAGVRSGKYGHDLTEDQWLELLAILAGVVDLLRYLADVDELPRWVRTMCGVGASLVEVFVTHADRERSREVARAEKK